MWVHRIIRLTISVLVLALKMLSSRYPNAHRPSITILLYHSVSVDEGARFARQMDALLKRAAPVAITQLHDKKSSTPKVAVTFDDGYRSFREHALPELVKRNIPVAVFVPSRLLGKEPLFSAKYTLQGGETIMTDEELLHLPGDLVTIGSHCQTHPHLLLLDEEKAWQEISGSRKDLESLLGCTVSTIAFPFGEYNQKTLKLCGRAGYKYAFSALPSRYDGFLCGRIETDPHDWPLEFGLKIRGAYCWLPWAVNLKRKVRGLFDRSKKKKGEEDKE